jgi:DNA-binding transcriptional LysR family regulator
MDIDQIETFLAIAQVGGFTRAASRLRRSQPAISRRMSLLEAELGAPLLERVRGAVQLTDLGRAFRPHVEAMLAAMNDGREAVRSQLREGAGNTSLAVVGTLVDRRLASLLRRFSGQFDQSPLKVLTASSGEVSHLVRRGEVTLGVRYFADRDPELECRAIGQEAMVVIAGARHAQGVRAPRHARVLLRWIGFPTSKTSKEAFGRLLRRQLASAGLDVSEVMEVDSLSAQKRLVEAGFGLALLPRSSVSEELSAGTLKVLRMPQLSTCIPLTIVYRRRGYLSPAARALLELLTKAWAHTAAASQRT